MGTINWNNRINQMKMAKAQVRSLIGYNSKKELTHDELLIWKKDLKKSLKNQKLPNYMLHEFDGYFEALFDEFVNKNIIFLYKFKNKFYSTKGEIDGVPKWDTLPREIWPDLSHYGGFYYRNSFKHFQ